MKNTLFRAVLAFSLLGAAQLLLASSTAPSLMEKLNRGVVALRTGDTTAYVGWRLLGPEYGKDVTFNLYRSTGGGAAVLLNGTPIADSTNYADGAVDLTQSVVYSVRPVVDGLEQAVDGAFTLAGNAATQQYLSIPLTPPPGGTNASGSYDYTTPTAGANDCSVADLDGDGEYEVVLKWDPSNSKDNAQSGYTGSVYLDAYKLNGTRLWRIDLGVNIRAGAHYTQFMVYDLDGDGKAEVVCKTAPGTIDGTGNYVLLGSDSATADYRNSSGYILTGPEYLTVFNGKTGANLSTIYYKPARNSSVTSSDVSGWGDNYGNRVDRFLACVAYLDGQRPSVVMCRGYYTRATLWALDYRDGALTQRWLFDSYDGTTGNSDYSGQGNHNLAVADVDGDGKDEIIYGSCTIDDDGTGLYSTKLYHGDALHVSDMIPSRPGLEVWVCHEDYGSNGGFGHTLRDAGTGEIFFSVPSSTDAGRAMAADIDPRYAGYEVWGARTNPVSTETLTVIATAKPPMNFAVWWDGDLLREMLDGTTISKWDYTSDRTTTLLSPADVASCNSTKATPCLSADLFGDWREEVIWKKSDNTELRIYSTTIPTTQRLYTLMHDRQYREAIAWQNVAYNQPPNPSFFLGYGMAAAPVPNIVTSLATLQAPTATITGVSEDTGASSGDAVTKDATLTLRGTVTVSHCPVTVLLEGKIIGTTTADAAGAWSFDYTATMLAEGSHKFTVTADDAVGNTGVVSANYVVVIDTTAPTAPVISRAALSDGTVTVSGTAEAASIVKLSLDGTDVGTATVATDGIWSISLGTSLGATSHNFAAKATDVAGNVSAPSAVAVVDTAVTTPVITGIADDRGRSAIDGLTSDATLIISGTAGAHAAITVYSSSTAIGTTVADSAGVWSFDYSSTTLADGSYGFSAGSGNSLISASYAVTIDTTAPTVSSIVRTTPTTATITSSTTSVVYRVTFGEEVTGVAPSDFTVTATGTATGSLAAVTAVSATIYDVTVAVAGVGTVRLDLNSGSTGIADAAGNTALGYTGGESYTRVNWTTGSGTWVETASGGSWSDGDNWDGGVIADGAANSASLSALDITTDNVVHLDSARTLNNLSFADTTPTTAGSWIIDSNVARANTLTLAGPAPTITVAALGTGGTAKISAALAGTAGLTKAGAGTLILGGENLLTGAINVTAGTLNLGAGGTLAPAAAVSASGGGSIVVDGGTLTVSGASTLVNKTTSYAPSLIVNGGSVALNGGLTTTSSGQDGVVFKVTGGTVTVPNVSFARGSYTTTPAYTSGFIITGGATTAGTVTLGALNSSAALSIEGGSLNATGAVVVGNQATSGRGGAVRVTGGTFTSTDATDGLVLVKTTGNAAYATFSGGVTTLEKLTLGYNSAVTAGSGTVTLSGGTVYLGSGGIVKNGTSGMTTTITLSSGTLGASADWSTAHAIAVSGATTLKAADAAEVAHNITLSGVISGAGAITKSGGGTLTLSGASTTTGAIAVGAGTLKVDGSLAATTGALTVNSGGTLAGTGTVSKAIALNSGGTISPAGAATGTLAGVSLTWNAGGRFAADLGSNSDRLTLSGALTKGTAGNYPFVFSGSPSIGSVFTLASFGSTTFAAADFSYSGLSGVAGAFSITGTNLLFTVTELPDAAFKTWAASLPAGQQGVTADPDGDGLVNLLEFALGLDAGVVNAESFTASVITVDGAEYPAITYTRRIDRGGVTVNVLVSPTLDFGTTLGAVELSATPAGTGFETVVARSAAPLATQPRQFFRLSASLLSN